MKDERVWPADCSSLWCFARANMYAYILTSYVHRCTSKDYNDLALFAVFTCYCSVCYCSVSRGLSSACAPLCSLVTAFALDACYASVQYLCVGLCIAAVLRLSMVTYTMTCTVFSYICCHRLRMRRNEKEGCNGICAPVSSMIHLSARTPLPGWRLGYVDDQAHPVAVFICLS